MGRVRICAASGSMFKMSAMGSGRLCEWMPGLLYSQFIYCSEAYSPKKEFNYFTLAIAQLLLSRIKLYPCSLLQLNLDRRERLKAQNQWHKILKYVKIMKQHCERHPDIP
jgi:hypothetical protein